MTTLSNITDDLNVTLEPTKILQSLYREAAEGDSDVVQNEVELNFSLSSSRPIDFKDSRFKVQFKVSETDEGQNLTSNANLGTLRGTGEDDVHQFDGGLATIIKVANLEVGKYATFNIGPIVTSYRAGPSMVQINSIDVPGYSDHSFHFTLKKIAHAFIKRFNIRYRRTKWEDNELKVLFKFDWEIEAAENGVVLKYGGGKFEKLDPKGWRELTLTQKEIEEYKSVKLVAKGKLVEGRKNTDRLIREIRFPTKRISEYFEIYSSSIRTNSLIISEEKRAKRNLEFGIKAKNPEATIEITKEKGFFVALFGVNHLQIDNPEDAFSITSEEGWMIKHVSKEHPDTTQVNYFWYLTPPESTYSPTTENPLRFRISNVIANDDGPTEVCFGFEEHDEEYFTEYISRKIDKHPLMKLSSFQGQVDSETNEVIRLTFAVENAVRATLSYQCTGETGALLPSSKHWSYDSERLIKGGTWSGEQEQPERHENDKAGNQIRQYFHNPEGQRSDNNSATLILYDGGGQIHTATWVKTKEVSHSNFQEYSDVI